MRVQRTQGPRGGVHSRPQRPCWTRSAQTRRGTLRVSGAVGPPGLGPREPGVPPGTMPFTDSWMSTAATPAPHDRHSWPLCGWPCVRGGQGPSAGPWALAPRLSQHSGLGDLPRPPTPHTCGGHSQEHTHGAGTPCPQPTCPPRGTPRVSSRGPASSPHPVPSRGARQRPSISAL